VTSGEVNTVMTGYTQEVSELLVLMRKRLSSGPVEQKNKDVKPTGERDRRWDVGPGKCGAAGASWGWLMRTRTFWGSATALTRRLVTPRVRRSSVVDDQGCESVRD
jgi:hypothetical protein